MAGIDKIYLKSYNEYNHLKTFLARYDPEFFKGSKKFVDYGKETEFHIVWI